MSETIESQICYKEGLRIVTPGYFTFDRPPAEFELRSVASCPPAITQKLRNYVSIQGPDFNLIVLQQGEGFVNPVSYRSYRRSSCEEDIFLLVVKDERKAGPNFFKGFTQILNGEEPTTLEADADKLRTAVAEIQSHF